MKKISFCRPNRKGFSLPEALLALSIFALLQAAFTQIVALELDFHQYLNQQYDDDWAIFSLKMDRLAQTSRLKRVRPQSLETIDAQGDNISFSFYKNDDSRMIRRLKNFTGHQPVLMQVQTYRVTEISPQAVRLQVEMTNGEYYEQILTFKQ